MIDTFISRPNWAPPMIEKELELFYQLLDDQGFKAHTIGKTQTSLRTPFDDVRRLMSKCKCTIVLGLPQIFIDEGSIKHEPLTAKLMLPTEWNQIEATMSLMLELPTLVLLHKHVSSRGIFDRGAGNIFVHSFDSTEPNWVGSVRPGLAALKSEIGA
jgi:hypothetical protein